MGYIRHEAIIVTTHNKKLINKAHKKAKEFMTNPEVSNIVESRTNGYYSFFIAPDGSKEGWPDSSDGEKERERFMEWIEQQRYEDNSNSYDCVHVFYDEEGMTEVLRID